MAVTVNNIVVYGAPKFYVAPATTAAPTSSIAYGTAWGGTWADGGATFGDISIKHSTEDNVIRVDQYTAGVKQVRVTEEVTFTIPMSEATLTNIKYAQGNGTLTSGSTENTLVFGAQTANVTPYAFGFEGYGPSTTDAVSKYRRYVFYSCTVADTPEYALKRGEETIVGASFRCLVDTTQAANSELYRIIDRV